MKDTWDGNTRGLGAGSYPAAPDIPEYEDPACAECGWQQGLREIDGVLLCRDCAKKYVLEQCEESFWAFITGSPEEKRRFALEWWFQNLPEETQGEVAFRAFQREFDSCLPQTLNLRDQEITGYTAEYAGDFLDYMEKERRI